MSKKASILILFIAILILSGCSCELWGKGEKTETRPQQIKEEQQIEENQEKTVDIRNWNTYRDEKYKFEIKYNPKWKIKEAIGPAIGGDFLQVVVDESRNDIGMGINRFRSCRNPKIWIKDEGIGGITSDKQFFINEYPVYYMENNNESVHLLHDYLISGEGKIIWFSFQEKYRKVDPKTGEVSETSFSQYLLDFKTMVGTIKFFD